MVDVDKELASALEYRRRREEFPADIFTMDKAKVDPMMRKRARWQLVQNTIGKASENGQRIYLSD
jgi:hypothetical protein